NRRTRLLFLLSYTNKPGSEDIVPITSIAQFMLKGLVPRLLSIELPDGCYRSMVFVLNKGAVKIADRKMDYATVKNLLRFGAKELDQELRDMKYTGEHKTTVLIYQYHRSDTNISFVEPDDGRRIEAGEHLFRAGLGTLMGPKTRSDDDHRR
ncbi:MAG: hypothetical protein OXP36_11060, partial [Gammaproteobacteria bacterium]|nr:hypothetical protein [Gammaproteobacteria bacterium]